MSVSASSQAVAEKRTLSTLLAGRVVKRLKQEDGERLREATIQLLEQQQNICGLLREVQDPALHGTSRTQDGEQQQSAPISSAVAGSLLACELRHQASLLDVPVAVLAVKTVLQRMMEITGAEEDERRGLLTSSQRVQLCVLLESSKQLLSEGALCPKLLWQEYRRDQRQPSLEVLYHLHSSNILTLKYVLESDQGLRPWLASQLKSLCSWTPPPGEDQTRQVQIQVLSTVVGVLVGASFQPSHEPESGPRRTPQLCCSVLDDMLSWLLDTVDTSVQPQTVTAGVESWIQIFDASLCGVSVSADTLRTFFMYSLTQTLTYKPRLTVSDAIAQQNEWTFAKASPLMTSLFRKLAVIFSVEQLLRHLQQILETHEVNWRHVLCFVSTLLVYNPRAQASLRELLSQLLSGAFEGYDLEGMITAFLLARQAALQGPAIFPSYSDWFKMTFGGGSSFHASSKKSVVFLLKFLSDLVPFEPPQYLKIHILRPPFVPAKHRGLLMEYVSLAKTRLADLKESVEDMGLYEDVSGAGGAAVQPQCQAAQDVEKALSLFENTGRIPATVMEASIFRKSYFLTRFLPALLTPRVLPRKADTRMTFIDMMKKAEKIPEAQFSSYVESCKNHKPQDDRASKVSAVAPGDPVEALRLQLQGFTELNVEGNEEEMSAQLSRISHSLSLLFPGHHPDQTVEQPVIKLHIEAPPASELHVKVVNMILRNFCQCTLDTSRASPPNKQSLWASRFVSTLLGNTQLLSSLIHRLWDLFHNQGPLLSAAHLLGLAVLMVHLHASTSPGPSVELVPPTLAGPVPVEAALSSGLLCNTHTNMQFSVRLCVAAVCYGMCRGDPEQQQQDYVLPSFYKMLQYLVPRLVPEARRAGASAGGDEVESVWRTVTQSDDTWRKTALQLWRQPAFSQLQQQPQYQLSLSDWLVYELRVQRSEDALTDPERQEYQQWALLELYLPLPEAQGGCGGDLKNLCSCLLNAIMDQQSSSQDKLDPRASETGTCVPDVLSRLQELVYEMETSGADVHDFLFELASQRFSSAETGASMSSTLGLQHALNTWNRVLLALPAVLFIKVRTEGGSSTLDCSELMEHVNRHQRSGCSPAGLLPCHVTAHFLRGLLCAGARCRNSAKEVNRAWSQISQRCPLLLVSAVHWWQRVSPVLLCLWRRLCDAERLPEQLQLLSDSSSWACSPQSAPSPVAAPLLLAASLHRACPAPDSQGFTAALSVLQPQREPQHRQTLVFLLFLCVNDYLSALLDPQERSGQRSSSLCSQLLAVLVDSADWLLIFQSNERGAYQATTMVTSEDFSRLMPWAFYSLLLRQSPELLHRAARCPGFLHTAVLCYLSLMQLFLEGRTFAASDHQLEQPDQVLSRAKQLLLSTISQAPPTALSSNRLRQLEAQCSDLDPEVAAALSAQLEPPSLSPEMDFL